MNIWNIWILKKGNQKLILKSMPIPEQYWIEIYKDSSSTPFEVSERVHQWEDACELLQKYEWAKYETVGVDAAFTRKITDFRRKTRTYRKPTSRERILELYDRFRQGEEISLAKVSYEFGVGKEEIKRDITILKDFLKREQKTIQFFRRKNVYQQIEDLSELEYEEEM